MSASAAERVESYVHDDGTIITVGEVLRTTRQFQVAPVGSTCRWTDGSMWQKFDRGWGRQEANGGGVEALKLGENTLVSIGPPRPDASRIGQVLSSSEMDALPLGSKLRTPRDSIMVKVAMGSHLQEPFKWQREVDAEGRPGDGHRYQLASNRNTLLSIGGSAPRYETYAQFRQRFAEAVVAESSKWEESHQTLAQRALRDLKVSTIIGSTINYTSKSAVGTVAVSGSPDQARFTIFRRDEGGWVKVHGYFNDIKDAGMCTVTSSPDADTVFAEVEGDQEALIAGFRDQVWQMGQDIKQKNEWCSAYDKFLAEFGILDPAGMPDFSAWPLVKGEEKRAELPTGAVLGVARGDWGIFVKTGLPNDWRRIAGTRPLAAGTMHLLFNGEGRLHVDNANGLLDSLPPGTQIEYPGAKEDPDIPFTKTANGMWARPRGMRGGYKPEQFTDPVSVIAWP